MYYIFNVISTNIVCEGIKNNHLISTDFTGYLKDEY